MAFTLPEFFQRLQSMQDQHDQHYHADVYTLSRADNLRHMTLHMGKYLGKLAQFERDGKALDPAVEGVLVDWLIICMSSACRLNFNLGVALHEKTLTGDLWERHHGSYPNPETADEAIRQIANEQILGKGSRLSIVHLAIPVGRMAKALEALDHLEDFDSRGVLEASVKEVFMQVLALWAHYSPHAKFSACMRARLEHVESRNFMYRFKPKYRENFKAPL
jgi:hypothetical protein